MDKLDESLRRLEERIAQAESSSRTLSDENVRLRAAMGAPPHRADAGNGAPGDGLPLRLILLEAERKEIRSRIRNLIEVL